MEVSIISRNNLIKKYFKLNYGYFLVIFGIITLFFIPLRVLLPPESALPTSFQPFWLANPNANAIVVAISLVILITSLFAIIYGIRDILIGLEEQSKYFSKENFMAKFLQKTESDRKFLIFSIYTFLWFAIWLLNTLTAKIGPIEFPLFFIRQNVLQSKLPDKPASELSAYSSYNIIGLGMDFGIFLIFLYFIYVIVRPEIQKIEYVIKFIFDSNIFFFLLIFVTGLHLLGHLPLELYGRFGGFESGLINEPETGLGQSFTEGWFAFDKLTHYFSSLLIFIIIVPFVLEQQKFTIPEEIKEFRESLAKPNRFTYITALSYLVLLGVVWELAELILNIFMFELGAINIDHFNLEYNDSLKDLVFDFLGGVTGITITYLNFKWSSTQ